jgi:malonate decarboxylase gamma subunit
MNIESTLDKIFPGGYQIKKDGLVISGSGVCKGQAVAIVGMVDRVAIGVEIAYKLAAAVLEIIQNCPQRPILLMVDTQGQRLTLRDELLANNSYLAHLAKCLELARLRGHRVVSLVYGEAVSGGFFATGMMAERAYALPDAEIRVMALQAMTRVTKIPLEQLVELCKNSAIFAPGINNFVRLGIIEEVWHAELEDCLDRALLLPVVYDNRAELGRERGGREWAAKVAFRIRTSAEKA